jgi:hypothetical protein
LCLSDLEAAVDSGKWSPSGVSDRFSPQEYVIPNRFLTVQLRHRIQTIWLLVMRALIFGLLLLAMTATVPFAIAQKVALFIDVSKPGAKIDRNVFGQFAEHLGYGVMKAFGLARTPKFQTHEGSVTTLLLHLKR